MYGIIESGHSLITLLFAFKLNHNGIHQLNSKPFGVLRGHQRPSVYGAKDQATLPTE